MKAGAMPGDAREPAGPAALARIRTLIAPLAARIDRDQIGTHAPDCHTYHWECLVLALERELRRNE